MAKTIRSYFLALVSNAHKVTELKRQLEVETVGTYSNAVAAAILAGDLEKFEEAAESFYNEIRSNKRGIATRLKCKPADNQPEGTPEGETAVWAIPNSLMSARSTMKGAFTHNVKLTGDDGKARAFKAIKEDVSACTRAAKRKELKGDALLKAQIRENLDGITVQVGRCKTSVELANILAATTTALQAARDSVQTVEAEVQASKAAKAPARAAAKKPATRKKAASKGKARKPAAKRASRKAKASTNADIAAAA